MALKSILILLTSSLLLSGCVLEQRSDYINLDKVREIAKTGGGSIILSDVIRNDVSMICEFWPYTDYEMFSESIIYQEIIGSPMFPVEENEWGIFYFDGEGAALGWEKFFRHDTKLKRKDILWRDIVADLDVRNNCNVPNEVLLNIVLRDDGKTALRLN